MATASIDIPPELVCNIVSYRFMKAPRKLRHIGCGFLLKGHLQEDWLDVAPKTYNLCYVLRGTGSYLDWTGKRHPLVPGNAFQRIPGRKHSNFVDAGSQWVECWLDIGPPLANDLAPCGLIDPDRPVLNPGLDLSMIRKIRHCADALPTAEEADLPRFLVSMLEMLADFYVMDRRQAGRDPDDGLTQEACRLLADKPEEHFHLQILASKFDMSYGRFRKVFRERMGMSPGQFRIRRRIDRARELLLSTFLSIQEIADQLGYSNPYTFSTQFRKVVGVSPNAFRKRH
jgi:AraC-like DNA-binding protein